MTLDQKQGQQTDTHNDTQKKDVDTDAEHDPARAHTHSKAALHRVADAGKDKSALHDKASQKTYSSVQSGLLLLAKEMHLSHQDLRDAQQDDPEHNNQVGVGTIERIFHMISADAANLNGVMAATENASTMGAEVKKVWGAWFTCQPEIDRALTWYRANGGAQQLSTAGIDQNVKAMIDKLGAKPEELAQDRKEPEGDAKAMSDQAFEDELNAASAALDSFEAGNSGDARKVGSLIQQIGVKGQYSSAFQRHRKSVVALQSRIEALRAKNPNDHVLNDAAFMLASGLKK